MRTQDVLIALVIGGLFAAVFAFAAYKAAQHAQRRWARYKKIVDTERTRIGMLRPGFFEVRGKVQMPDAPLESPMNKIPCVFYRFVVKERRTRTYYSGGKRRTKTEWITVVTDSRETDCVISDGNGRVRVPLTHAEGHYKTDSTRHSGFLNSPPEELRTLLQGRYGKDTQGMLFNKAMRYEETVISAGDELYVLGEVSKGPDGLEFRRGSVDRHDQMLLVTDRGEEYVRRHAFWGTVGSMLAAVLSVVIVVAIFGGLIWMFTQQ